MKSQTRSFAHHDILGRPVADFLLAEVTAQAAELVDRGLPPHLVSVTIGDVAAVDVYVRNQKRTAERAGIRFSMLALPAETTQADAVAALTRLNSDPAVTGIILQRPVPPHVSVKRLQSAIRPDKDVEGMHPASIGDIVYGQSAIGPCTALASVELLRRTGLKLEGLEVVVIGHSEIVGKPIAFLLMAEGATVTVCHHMTRSVAMHSRRADVVFVAVGRPHLVGPDMIKPGAVVIDIGINQVLDERGHSHVVGDVDYQAVRDIAGWVTPVPGGVGPVTVAMLMRNCVRAAQSQLAGRPLPASASAPSRSVAAIDQIFIRDLVLPMRIGVHQHERKTEQRIMVNVAMNCERRLIDGVQWPVVCYETIAQRIRQLSQRGHVDLVEEFADQIAGLCLADSRVRRVEIQVEKTDAVAGASGVGARIVRTP